MINSKKILLGLTVILASFIISACATEEATSDTIEDSDITDTTTIEDENVDVEGNTDGVVDNTRRVDGINLIAEYAINTEEQPGANAGTLVVTVTLENTTDEPVTLDLETEDYIIRDGEGINIVPTTIADELVNPEIDAGESVFGEVEFAVEDSASNFFFSVEGFDEVEIDANSAD